MVCDYVVPDDIWEPGTLRPEEWHMIENTIKEQGVRTVLEFGSGISTYAFRLLGLDCTSFEDKSMWVKKLHTDYQCSVIKWGVKYMRLDRRFDMAFVDGPHQAIRREIPFQMAADHSDLVICHDTHNEHIVGFEEKYLHEFTKIKDLPHLSVWKRCDTKNS
jgi:hypothetical protein